MTGSVGVVEVGGRVEVETRAIVEVGMRVCLGDITGVCEMEMVFQMSLGELCW